MLNQKPENKMIITIVYLLVQRHMVLLVINASNSSNRLECKYRKFQEKTVYLFSNPKYLNGHATRQAACIIGLPTASSSLEVLFNFNLQKAELLKTKKQIIYISFYILLDKISFNACEQVTSVETFLDLMADPFNY